MSFFLILFSQCSITDPKEIFLNDFSGTWKTCPAATPWFDNLLPKVVVIEGTIVNVATDGSFTVAGTVAGVPVTVQFTFIEIEKNGILAVYKIKNGAQTVYAGIGFGQKDHILITPVVNSPDLVISTDQGVDKGTMFLTK